MSRGLGDVYKRQLKGTAGDYHLIGCQHARLTLLKQSDLAPPVQRPYRSFRKVFGTAGAKGADQFPPSLIFISQLSGAMLRNRFHGPVDLATRRHLFIKYRDVNTLFCGHRGGGQTRGSGTNDCQLIVLFHGGKSPVPCWHSMRMPSRTSFIHAR